MFASKGLIRPYSFLLIQVNRVADALWIVFSLLFSLRVWQESSDSALWIGIAGALMFALSAEFKNLYRSWRVAPLQEELSVIWRSWLLAAMSTIVGLYLFEDQVRIGKVPVLMWVCLVPVFLSITRIAARLALRAGRRAGRNFRTAAVVGANRTGRRAAERLLFNRWMGIQLVGYFDQRDPRGNRPLEQHPVGIVGDYDDLVDKAQAGALDIVYIALPMRAELRVKELVERLADTLVEVYYVADFSAFEMLHAQWETLGDMPVLRLINSPFAGFNGFAKRAQDILIASSLLVVLALPMLIIALVIRLDSPGPAMYRQSRHGLDGREFTIFKFRTMRSANDGDAAFRQATRDDARVTRVGRFLRRTSLDELPQLINVLQGRMSMVGPRPHPLELNEQHRHLIHHFVLRHKVRPGITGLAQINGFRGETETLDKMQKRLEYDLEYINNWSFWLDLRILVSTIFRVLKDRQAY